MATSLPNPSAFDSAWSLTALDGRYFNEMESMRLVASEAALNKYRLMVEAAWLLELVQLDPIKSQSPLSAKIDSLLVNMSRGQISDEILKNVKLHEQKTNHDVKAVEYALRDELLKAGGSDALLPWIHFACTSEDINNLSYALMLQDLRKQVLLPTISKISETIEAMAIKYSALPMLSRTHGQTATPTTLGKEMAVFVGRLNRQIGRLTEQEILGKLNGAVGNFNAHSIAFPEIDWIQVSKNFVEHRLGLTWNGLTTQIEPHDSYVEYMSTVKHINMVLLDFARDMWGYISLGYFAQKVVAGEVGSSTMPHKVNPIYFENCEGNLGVANSLLTHFGDKLPVSRFQRDLSDSTVLRLTGTAIGHTHLAWKALLKGLDRVDVNQKAIDEDLDQAWEVLGEAVQTVMRRYGVKDAYERLKKATRGEANVTREMIQKCIDDAPEIPLVDKQRLRSLTPRQYVGLAEKLCKTQMRSSR
ncbi:MAG: adenylosuccinate lyase [Proteobacteria bacterium]|nr:adenylosuccinate lyase [Pseudomonadota bacterium]